MRITFCATDLLATAAGGMFPSSEVCLSLDLTMFTRDGLERSCLLTGEVALSSDGFDVTWRCEAFGGHLDGLRRGLLSIHERGTGSAALLDTEPRWLLVFTASPERDPYVMLSGNWDQMLGSDVGLSKDESATGLSETGLPARPGLWVIFQGLAVHRDQLPVIAAQLEELLTVTGVERTTGW